MEGMKPAGFLTLCAWGLGPPRFKLRIFKDVDTSFMGLEFGIESLTIRSAFNPPTQTTKVFSGECYGVKSRT